MDFILSYSNADAEFWQVYIVKTLLGAFERKVIGKPLSCGD
ncbi:hypothetical protein [Mesorhizobium sp. M1403]